MERATLPELGTAARLTETHRTRAFHCLSSIAPVIFIAFPIEEDRMRAMVVSGILLVLTENGKIKRLTDYYDLPSFFRKPPTDTTKASVGNENRGPSTP